MRRRWACVTPLSGRAREESDARVILNPADVKLRSFSTKARPCLCMSVALCPGYGAWRAPETCRRAGVQVHNVNALVSYRADAE